MSSRCRTQSLPLSSLVAARNDSPTTTNPSKKHQNKPQSAHYARIHFTRCTSIGRRWKETKNTEIVCAVKEIKWFPHAHTDSPATHRRLIDEDEMKKDRKKQSVLKIATYVASGNAYIANTVRFARIHLWFDLLFKFLVCATVFDLCMRESLASA